MKENKKRSRSILKFLLLGCFVTLMCWLTMKDNAQEIIVQLSMIRGSDLIILIFISALMYVISGIILYVLAKKCEPTYRLRDGIEVSFITMFTSNVMFSATSKLVQYFLFYRKKIKMDAATCIIALEFLSYQILMMIFSLLMMIAYHSYYASALPHELPLAWFGTLISFLPLVGVSLLLWYPPIQQIIRKLIQFGIKHLHLKLDAEAIDVRLSQFMTCLIQIKEEFLHDRKLMMELLIWNIIRHMVKHCVPFVIALMLDIPMSLHLAWMLFLTSMFLDLSKETCRTLLLQWNKWELNTAI